jgi:hypothetical protein
VETVKKERELMNYIKAKRSPEEEAMFELKKQLESEIEQAVALASEKHQAEIAQINRERFQKNERQRVWQEYKNQTEGANYTDVR